MNLLDRILSRCVEEGDCLIWTGPVSTGNGKPVPEIGVKIDGKWRVLKVRKALWIERNGPVADGKLIYSTCKTPLCVSCSACGTHAQWVAMRVKLGTTKHHPITRAKMSQAMRKKRGLPDATIRRASELLAEGRTQMSIALELGISQHTVWCVKKGRHTSIAGSSVFHQR